jgi:uncharacterized protein YjdB
VAINQKAGPPVAVTGVTVSPTTKTLEVGGTFTATATVAPSDATNPAVTWSSNATGIATVVGADGVGPATITAVTPGAATITVTTADGGHKATVVVTVNAPAVPVTGVTVSPTTKTLVVDETFTATATVAPANATNQAVTWSSDDETVATVVDGLVTAVNVGEATITVTTADGGHTATVAITVELPEEQQAALDLAEALGNGNASVSGANVTLTNNISIANVEIPAGVTLVVPAEITLTVNGTLSGTGTITVEGIVDAGTGTFPGTANLLDGSASKGLIAEPTDAASDWVWKFYGRTWSDVINVPACNQSNFVLSTTSAECRSATADAGTLRYYYNWKYVDDNNTTMCPSGWRVPAEADIKTFPEYDTSVSSLLFSIWGYGGWFEDWGNGVIGHSSASAAMGLWSSTGNGDNAFIFYVASWGVDFNVSYPKSRGYQVRCVKD